MIYVGVFVSGFVDGVTQRIEHIEFLALAIMMTHIFLEPLHVNRPDTVLKKANSINPNE